MRVTRDTRDQLIFEQTAWHGAIFVLLGALVFLGLGLFFIRMGLSEDTGLVVFGSGFAAIGFVGCWMSLIFSKRRQAIFERSKQTVTLRQKSIFGYRAVVHDVSEISGAILDDLPPDTETDSPAARVCLHISDGQSAGLHPVTDYDTNLRRQTQRRDKINTWLVRAKQKQAA